MKSLLVKTLRYSNSNSTSVLYYLNLDEKAVGKPQKKHKRRKVRVKLYPPTFMFDKHLIL